MARCCPCWSLSLSVLIVAFHFLPELVDGRPASTAGNTTIYANNNNDPNVHCNPTHWYDICWFFFANYILHALSVRSLPGESFYSAAVFKLCCLLIPYTGLRRGLCLISRAGNLAGNDLQAAARANALCMVIRKPGWMPHRGDEITGCQLEVHRTEANGAPASDLSKHKDDYELETAGIIESGSSRDHANSRDDNGLQVQITDLYSLPLCNGLVDRISRAVVETHRFQSKTPSCNLVDNHSFKLQGRCELVEGYALAYVPPDMKVYPRISSASNIVSAGHVPKGRCSQTRLASAHDFPRILFSITQTISGAYALYRARGSQIERYGYAAFGLTVLPFILVSLINLLASFLTSEYETIFLVHSSLMDEMIDRGGVSDGVVGTIHPPAEDGIHTPIVGREARMKNPGINVVFAGSEDCLTCHESTNLSGEPESYLVRPWTTSGLPERSRRKFLPSWPVWGTPTGAKPPSQASVKSKISIPSHPPFNRLPPPLSQDFLNTLSVILLVVAVAAPYTVIGILSHFKSNQATGTQKNFTLTWLILGQVQGYIVGDVEKLTGNKNVLKGLFYVFICYGSYCLCALVIVAQEMIEFGTCKAD
ncbi:hypothetical protein MMC07_003807 [Pseudocyphellaria aurata]|nr:hypothetical protein [Pseudocyphellaria aurata]